MMQVEIAERRLFARRRKSYVIDPLTCVEEAQAMGFGIRGSGMLGLGGSPAGGFRPALYSGTKSWYQADAGVTQGAGVATAVVDQGLAGGKNLSGSVGWGATAGPNSKPGFTFSGVQRLTCSDPQGFTANHSFSLIAVLKSDNPAGGPQYGYIGTGDSGIGGFSFETASPNRGLFIYTIGDTQFGAGVAATWELWIVTGTFNAVGPTCDFRRYVNGAQIGGTITGIPYAADGAGVTMIGGDVANPKPGGSLAEGGFIDHALSDADRVKFESALNAKYALF